MYLSPSLFWGCYTTYVDSWLPTFGEVVSEPFLKAKCSKKNSALSLKMEPIGSPKTSVASIPEEHVVIKYT